MDRPYTGTAPTVALLVAVLTGFCVPATAEDDARQQDVAVVGRLFNEHCAVCHGEQLQGTAQGVALIGRDLTGGATAAALETSIPEAAGRTRACRPGRRR